MTQSRSVAALAAAGGGATSLCRGWMAGAEAAASSRAAAAEGAAATSAEDTAAAVAMVCLFSLEFFERVEGNAFPCFSRDTLGSLAHGRGACVIFGVIFF